MNNYTSDSPIWLYDSFRGTLHVNYQTWKDVLIALELFPRLYNPLNKQSFPIVDNQDISYVGFLPGFNDFILAFYREGIALGRFLGQAPVEGRILSGIAESIHSFDIPIDAGPIKAWEVWKKADAESRNDFDCWVGMNYVEAMLEMVKFQSTLVTLKAGELIPKEHFDQAVSLVTKKMNEIGLNGLERLMISNPDLESVIAKDKRIMVIQEKHLHLELPEIVLGKQMTRGEYFLRVTQFNQRRKETDILWEKQKLWSLMAGQDYATAYKARVAAIESYEAKGRLNPTLNQSILQLNTVIMDKTAPAEERGAAFRAYLISYGLGENHERLQEIVESLKESPKPNQKLLGQIAQLSKSPADDKLDDQSWWKSFKRWVAF